MSDILVNAKCEPYYYLIIAGYGGKNLDKIISEMEVLLCRKLEYRMIEKDLYVLVTDFEASRITESDILYRNIYL